MTLFNTYWKDETIISSNIKVYSWRLYTSGWVRVMIFKLLFVLVLYRKAILPQNNCVL